MVLLGDEAQVESCFGHCKIGARFVPNKARKSFWPHPIELLGDDAQVESRFGPFGYSFSISAR